MLSLTLIFCLNFPRLYFMQFRKKHAIFCCHVLRSNNSIRPRILYIILYNIDVVICLKLLAEIGISLRTNMILFCWFILFMTGRNNYFHSEESVSAATLKTNGTGRNPQMSPTYGPRPTQRWAGGSSFTSSFYLYINSGRWYLSHVPSTFATLSAHANVFFVFLPGGISKEWRHILSANWHFEGNLPGQYRVFTGLLGNTWGDQK